MSEEASTRFGDYFDMALDPNDGTAWLLGEYARGWYRAGGAGRIAMRPGG